MTKKIFVVDDEPQIVKVLKAYLEKAGYQVVTASDGNTVLSIFRHEKPDFLILDLNLPGMDGRSWLNPWWVIQNHPTRPSKEQDW